MGVCGHTPLDQKYQKSKSRTVRDGRETGGRRRWRFGGGRTCTASVGSGCIRGARVLRALRRDWRPRGCGSGWRGADDLAGPVDDRVEVFAGGEAGLDGLGEVAEEVGGEGIETEKALTPRPPLPCAGEGSPGVTAGRAGGVWQARSARDHMRVWQARFAFNDKCGTPRYPEVAREWDGSCLTRW